MTRTQTIMWIFEYTKKTEYEKSEAHEILDGIYVWHNAKFVKLQKKFAVIIIPVDGYPY